MRGRAGAPIARRHRTPTSASQRALPLDLRGPRLFRPGLVDRHPHRRAGGASKGGGNAGRSPETGGSVGGGAKLASDGAKEVRGGMCEISRCLRAAAFMMGAIFVVSGGCGSKKAVDAPDSGAGGNLANGGTSGTPGGEGGTGPGGGHAGTGGAGGGGGWAVGGQGGGAGGMAGGCPAGTHILYTAPGCGTDAKPICHNDSSAGGACLSEVCGCDGKVHADGCGSSSSPFAYFTSSGPGGGGGPVCDAQGGAGGGPAGGAGGT